MRKCLTILSMLLTVSVSAQTPFAKLSIEKDKVMMEYPDSLLGRTLLLSTMVTSSGSPYMQRLKELSTNELFTVTKVDSSLVLVSKGSNYVISGSEESMERGVLNSNQGAVKSVLKIKKSTDGGKCYMVDISKLLSPSSSWVVNLKGEDYSNYSISNASFNADKSAIIGTDAFHNTVGVSRDVTYDLSLRTKMIVMDLKETVPCSMEIFTSLTLLEENDMPHKVADSRIGTRKVPFTKYSSDRGMKADEWAVRWDLREGRNIEVYIDTVLTPAQNKAVREAFDQWNIAFEKAGVSGRICAMDYPREGFRAEDPLMSIVTISGSDTYVSANLVSNGSDELLAMRFSIPAEYVSSVRRRSVYAISDVDPRYQPYYLGEEAVCEVLRADFLRLTGLCLGLTPNFAGSYAYTPAQILDPEFTSEFGFTASVTDDVLFNYLTRPGDKERGVATIIDKVGVYDIYALSWLYADGKISEEPQYFYSPRSAHDPRAIAYDLSNDVDAAFEAGVSHLYFVADHALEFHLADEDNSGSYRDLFVDWLWLRATNLVTMLSSRVGGYEYNAPRVGSTLPKYTPVSADEQRRSIRREFEFLRDMNWIDETPLLKLNLANVDASSYTRINAFTMSGLRTKLPNVARAYEWAGSGYSVEDYLEDVETMVFANARAGRFPYGEMHIIGQYVSWLASYVTLPAKDEIAGTAELSQEFLERACKELGRCRSRLKGKDRATIDYLIDLTEKKLNIK